MSKALAATVLELASTGSNLTSGTVDPTAGAGVPGVVGSAFVSLLGGTAILYLKTGALDTDWTPTVFGGQVSPAAITGTFNDYAPANLAGASTLRQDLSGATILTGLISTGGAAQGRMLIVANISTTPTNILTLVNESALSTPGNRFSLPGNVNFVVASNSSVTLAYDGISLRWRISGLSTPIVGTNIYSFTYRPGCGINAATLWDDWAAMMLAITLTPGKKEIFLDDSLAPIVIPAGIWDMVDTTWTGTVNSDTPVEVVEGASLPGLRNISTRLLVTFSGTTPPVDDFVAGETFGLFVSSTITTTGAGPFLQNNSASQAILALYLSARIYTGTTPTLHASMAGGGWFIVAAADLAVIEPNVVSTVAGASVGLLIGSSGSYLNEDQPGAAAVQSLNFTTARFNPTLTITADTIIASNDVAQVDPTGGIISVTLPTAFNYKGQQIVVKNVTASTNQITILPNGADTIDGAAQTQLTLPFATTTLISDGVSNWVIQASTVVDTDTVYNFVYRPGVGVSTANVFETWSELMVAASLVEGIKQFQIDDSLTTPAVLDAGTWDLTNCILSGFPKAGGVDCEIPEGTEFIQCRRITNSLRINFSGTTPVITDLDDGFTLTAILANALMIDNGAFITTTGAGPFIDGAVGLNFITLASGGTLSEGTVPIIRLSDPAASLLVMPISGATRMTNNVLKAVAGAQVNLFVASSTAGAALANFSEDQPAVVDPILFRNLTRARMLPSDNILVADGSATINQITRVDPTTGPIIVFLPAAFDERGVACTIKKVVGVVADDITITPDGADTIDGAATLVIPGATDRGSFTMTSDGVSDWIITASYP